MLKLPVGIQLWSVREDLKNDFEGTLKKLKEIYPKKDMWCWTGYIFEKDLQPGGKRYLPEYTDLMLNCIDVLVDGPFVQEKKNLMLRFRGSENQRLLHLKDGEIQKIE